MKGALAVLLVMWSLSGCGVRDDLPLYEPSAPARSWATDFRVEQASCDGEDMPHRLLPCAADIETLSVVQQDSGRVCLGPRQPGVRFQWRCLEQPMQLPSADEVALSRSEDGFSYLRQPPLLGPGTATRIRMTLKRIPDGRWVLIEDAQEGRVEAFARRQILYLILSR